MGSFSLIHWLVLGLVILLLFGGNRFSNMMSDVAKGLKSFKKGLAEDEEAPKPSEPRQLRSDADPIDVEPKRTTDRDEA
ncbi:twin-arginine translocase TatA/TatE family subunit [Sphingomicrobium nitratireducens]|uniref:twin-arginine translocase TatA/TatE family subunit n=1 Tax=Sphingomicrobium nitratireducens TaxID=2964666 RepID=UPI002240AB87|nr:twin-arginine translocase TatA/TatE family subunit [Sphingomicrobium nitratireducens]